MTIEDYQKNLRGVNGGTDFSPEFLVRNSAYQLFPEALRLIAKHI